MLEIIEQIKNFAHLIVDVVNQLGYLGVFILMAIESSFIPFPSEIILIPAGYLVKQGEMNMLIVFLAALAGSLTGAYINYFLALKLGRAALLKYGKYIFISEEKFLAIERQFLIHGSLVTFVCRLICGVRQLISIPAGVAKMPLGKFTLYTGLGAGIWSMILISLGYILGKGEDTVATAKLIGYWLLVVLIILSLAYYYWWFPKNKKASN